MTVPLPPDPDVVPDDPDEDAPPPPPVDEPHLDPDYTPPRIR